MPFSIAQSRTFRNSGIFVLLNCLLSLSGLTLYYVYHNSDFSKLSTIKGFVIKRVFRIIPLYAFLCFLVVIVFSHPSLNSIGWNKFMLNITGLFSVFDYTQYVLTGGWSIGNELVFYRVREKIQFRLMLIAKHKPDCKYPVLYS